MLAGLYLLVPIYRVYTRHATQRQLRFLVLLFWVMGYGLNLLKWAILQLDPYSNLYFSMPELFGYSGYLFAGHYFVKYPPSKRMMATVTILGLLAFLFTVTGTLMRSLRAQRDVEDLCRNLYLNTALEAIAVFLWIQALGQRPSLQKMSQWIHRLAPYTFGIYLVHPYLLTDMRFAVISNLLFTPILSIPLIAAFNFSLSLGIDFFCKKIPYVKAVL